jgi:hypothetical protein
MPSEITPSRILCVVSKARRAILAVLGFPFAKGEAIARAKNKQRARNDCETFHIAKILAIVTSGKSS